LNDPTDIAADGNGNVYIADKYNYRVRKVNAANIMTTVTGGGFGGYSGDGGPASAALINDGRSVAADAAGNVYITDFMNSRLRKINLAGMINTIAGPAGGFAGDGGPATAAAFGGINCVAVDTAGNIYMGDYYNVRIRKINTMGIVSTIAGNGATGFSGDGGPATAASFDGINSVAVDGSGNVYVADVNNHRIRKINAAGIITTLAGTGTIGFSGDGGPASVANLGYPNCVASDPSGNVYIADTYNNRVRRVSPAGIITTFAGNGWSGPGGDGGPATAAELESPRAVEIDAAGNVYLTVWVNRVRKVSGVYGQDIFCVGDTATFKTNGWGGVWSTGSSAIATIGSATGLITAVSAGVTTVTYSAGGVKATATINVNPLPYAGTISGPTSVCVGSSITLTTPATGGTWGVSTTGTASVSGGNVVGLWQGTTTISYTVTNSCGTTAATYPITVNPLPVMGIISGEYVLCIGSVYTLTVTTTGGVWSGALGNVGVADSLITALTAGTDTVLYTTTNMCGYRIGRHVVRVYEVYQCDSIAATSVVPANHMVDVYPNPCAAECMIYCGTGFSPGANAELYDMAGRLMATYPLSGSSTTIPVAMMTQGLYQLRIVTGELVMNRKLSVMR
jgi:hypothetical protein